MKEILGIDLGSENTTIYSSSQREVVFREPTCLAMERGTKQIREIGYLADSIQGKAPYSYRLVYPVQNGLIQDVDQCVLFLERALSRLNLGRKSFSVLFTCPSKTSAVNRNALVEIGRRLFAKEIFLESQAKISALGIGDHAYAPYATFVCDIGAGGADIALVSMGDIVVSDHVPIGGRLFDEEIRRYLRIKQHLYVGRKGAEYVKLRVGTLDDKESRLVEVSGRDTITNLPSSVILSSHEVKKLFEPLCERLALKILDLLSLVPPELVSDLTTSGLLLTGGTSALLGLREFLEKNLTIPVRLANPPMDAIAAGFQSYIDNRKER